MERSLQAAALDVRCGCKQIKKWVIKMSNLTQKENWKQLIRNKKLFDSIKDICPLDGCSVENPLDSSTWVLWPSTNATPEQISAAETLKHTIDVEAEVVSRITDKNYEKNQKTEVQGNADFQNLTDNLKTMTPTEWQAWLNNNVNDVASVKTLLYKMGLILMLLVRRVTSK